MLNEKTSDINTFTEGAIEAKNDLRFACPITTPCLTYMLLKEGVDLNRTIYEWFPVEKGYQKSDSITIKMLLLNMCGIQDFVRLVPIHPDSIVTPMEAINVAYKNKDLNFRPGEKFEYSNTNFNILGIIL